MEVSCVLLSMHWGIGILSLLAEPYGIRYNGVTQGNVTDAVISKGMLVQRGDKLQQIQDIPEDVKIMGLYGDRRRLQQNTTFRWMDGNLEFLPQQSSWGWVLCCSFRNPVH